MQRKAYCGLRKGSFYIYFPWFLMEKDWRKDLCFRNVLRYQSIPCSVLDECPKPYASFWSGLVELSFSLSAGISSMLLFKNRADREDMKLINCPKTESEEWLIPSIAVILYSSSPNLSLALGVSDTLETFFLKFSSQTKLFPFLWLTLKPSGLVVCSLFFLHVLCSALHI